MDALQALRGIAKISAVTIVAEVGDLLRFAQAPQLMGYRGMGTREDSSGTRHRRGGITRTGSVHLRRIVVEAVWACRHRPAVGGVLRTRQATLSLEVTAIGRELLGFIWATGSPSRLNSARRASGLGPSSHVSGSGAPCGEQNGSHAIPSRGPAPPPDAETQPKP
jgi:transposase